MIVIMIMMTNDIYDNDHLLCPKVPAPDHLLHRGGSAGGHSGLVSSSFARCVQSVLIFVA